MKFNFHYLGYGLAALLVMGLLVAYHNATLDKVRSDAVQAAQATVIKQAQDDRAQHARDDAAREAATATLISSMQAQAAQQKTPVQITGWSQAQLEQAIKGIQITVPAPTIDNPHPSASVTIPEASLPGLRDTIEKCKECDAQLTAVRQDVASRDAQMKLADQQIKALETQRDAAIKASKGGSFLKRFAKGAKVVACAAAGGAAGGASGKGAIPAAIGAGAGAVACSLF